jgi:hypothetical protein
MDVHNPTVLYRRHDDAAALWHYANVVASRRAAGACSVACKKFGNIGTAKATGTVFVMAQALRVPEIIGSRQAVVFAPQRHSRDRAPD